MKVIAILALVALAGWWGYQHFLAADGLNVSVQEDAVLLTTDDLDVRFKPSAQMQSTFVIFGGAETDHGNAVARVTLAGLDVRKARPIYARYPDFVKCKSPGAALAQNATQQLNLVPGNRRTLTTLQDALRTFSNNLREGGDRVCVSLEGTGLEMESARVREADEDLTAQLGGIDYFLVTSASSVECKQALEGS